MRNHLLLAVALAHVAACGSGESGGGAAPAAASAAGASNGGAGLGGASQTGKGGDAAAGAQAGATQAGGGTTSTAGNGAGGGAAGATTGGLVTYGDAYTGGEFHLGPVDWAESSFHNACAPGGGYAPAVQKAEGQLLAGLWVGIPGVAGYCDACIHVVTGKGKSALLRVVTYGDTTPNSIDVSPEAFQLLDSGEVPRTMTWKLARCDDTGNVMVEFQTQASEWWTSLWVRNARVPLKSVEVKSQNHASYTALSRGGDGTLTDGAGFGKGPFTLRLTGIDGQVWTNDFAWPSSGIAGATLTGKGNLQ